MKIYCCNKYTNCNAMFVQRALQD